MSWIDWLIMIVPMAFILYMGYYSRRYIKGISDYLAAGRLAGRYVISVGDVALGLAVITLIGYVEARYKTGFSMSFWENILAPVTIVISLTGFCTYRFRETKAMSLGQFLELRYNRKLRVYASGLRSVAELLANCMCPALAARFLIYYLDFPQTVPIFGIEVPTFMLLTLLVITMCLFICCCGGCLSLLITDTIQGFLCYPLLIIFTLFVITQVSWGDVVVPVMQNRVPGESFLNPYDIKGLRDFNMFALIVTVYSAIVNRANWLGVGATISARSAHEGKMAGILGDWRAVFGNLLYILLVILIIASLNHPVFAKKAKDIRDTLCKQVLGEVVIENKELQGKINADLKAMPPADYVIGGSRPQDAPLSQDKNLDTPHLERVKQHLGSTPDGAAKYQEFFTLYHQMMLPVTMRNLLPTGMVGLFALFILTMMLSTDDSRLFSAAQTIVQDCVLPFCKAGVSPERHVMLVKLTVIGCGIFWFIGSFFMSQLDYVNMFVTIMCSLWIGAGPMMLFGLYSRFGNTTGAFSSLISGMVLALSFIFLQRYWASLIYPALDANGMLPAVTAFFEGCSAPFEPWIVWRVTPHKFPINSIEINFIIMIFCLLAYIVGSLVTFKQPFNLDRMLHRGIYNTDGENKEQFKWGFRTVINKLIGITPEFTKGDKAITWSIFIYTIVFRFLIAFILVAVLNIFWPWKPEWWGTYFYILYLAVPLVISAITMVWFVIGGTLDIKQLFKDLSTREVNPLDNGQVEGNVNLADTAAFAEAEKKNYDSDNQN